MLFTPNRLVIFKRGRYTGCKAIVLKTNDQEKSVVVVGMSKIPKKTTEEMSDRAKARRNKMVVFVKKMNPRHLLISRYNSQLDFSSINVDEAFEDVANKKNVVNSCEEVFRKAYDNEKEKWLFTKLKY